MSTQRGFVLTIADGKARLRWIGYEGDEGHKRSHELREAIDRAGVQTLAKPFVVEHEHVDEKRSVTS